MRISKLAVNSYQLSNQLAILTGTNDAILTLDCRSGRKCDLEGDSGIHSQIQNHWNARGRAVSSRVQVSRCVGTFLVSVK